MYADTKCQLSDCGRFTGLSNFTEDPQVLHRGIKVSNLSQFAIPLTHSKEDIVFDLRNDADVYMVRLVIVEKYNFRITVKLFLSLSDFERLRVKI